MSRRTRYQQGSVQREKRHSGPDVWIYRWYETGTDGNSKYRKAIVGTVATLANQTSALKAAQALRIDANHEAPHTEGGPKTVAELIAHYRLKELAGDNQGRKAFSTRAAYECYLNAWVLPRWGTYRIDQVKPVAVEAWLDGIKRANGTKAKIRNLMSAVFQHAMRYEWMEPKSHSARASEREAGESARCPGTGRTSASTHQARCTGTNAGAARRGNWPSGE